MPIFDGNLPYTNFHELNNDWIVKTVKEVKDKTEQIDESVAQAEEYAEQAKESAETLKQTFITPEMFGAVGDGITDDTVALQEAINYSLYNKVKLMAGGKKYLISDSVSVEGYRNPDTLTVERGENIDIDLSQADIIYTGSDFAFTIAMINHGYFRFGNIISTLGGGIFINTTDRWHYVAYLEISGGSISANALKDCILVRNRATGWANQNVIKYITFTSGLYAVHMLSESTNKINEWVIDTVSLEGVTNGHYLEAKSDDDVNVFIEAIKFIYNRAIEHINAGKKFLITYGRVKDCYIVGYYGNFANPDTYEFNYDASGTTSYSHIMSNSRISSNRGDLFIYNGKFINNPLMLESACNIDPIAEISNESDSIYKNYFGQISDFETAMPSFKTDIASATYANLNTKWLNGAPLDTQTSKQLLQELTLSNGAQYIRNIASGTFKDWFMRPVVKSERKVLHQSTFNVQMNAHGLLLLTNVSANYYALYLVRFGSNQAPMKILSSLNTDWTITKQDNYTLYFENTTYPTSEQIVSFIQLY